MITISEAKNEECQHIRLLEQRIWGADVTSPYDAAFFVRYQYAFVARDKDAIIGALIAMKTRNNEIKIVDVVVDERYRGNHIGQKLIERAGNAPLIAFVNPVNKAALEMHKKLGFRKLEEMVDPFYLGTEGIWFLMKRV